MSIKLEVIRETDKEIQNIDITQLVGSVTWSGDFQEASRTLEFDMIVSPYDKNIPKVDVKCGDVVKFYENNTELFRGYVLFRRRSYNSTKMSFECLDRGFYLINNEGAYNFKGKTPEEVAKKLCSDFGIPVGSIASTGYKFDKKFTGTNLDEIIMTFYTLASTKNNKKYMALFKEDKLNVIEKGVKVLDVEFHNGNNIIDSTFSEDIRDIKSKVTVIDDDGKVIHTKVDNNLVKLYGSFQKVLKKEEGKDYKDQANKAIKDISQKAEIKGFGDTSCVTGYGVHVKDGYTGLTGLFYIDQDKHKWENGVYTIELTLNFKNIMNEVEAGDDDKENEESSSSNSTNVSGGKTVNAEFTAYYPANNSMQGGLYDAQGNKLDPKKLTCAAPKEVSFGTKIQVLDTGTSKDNQVYKCTDRGGAIKIVNGVYKIDLLMASKEECYKFGRRKGKAKIGVETSQNNTSNDSSSNSSSDGSSSGSFKWPVPGHTRISSPYGNRKHPISGQYRMHSGIDIPAPSGTNIVASDGGTVICASSQGSYGNLVKIKHSNGYETRYAHCSRIVVSNGANVSKGQTIAKVGTTGSSTGNHLHFEVRKDGSAKNPNSYV